MSSPLSRAPSSNSYVLGGALRGHVGPVLAIRATDDGKLVASGGTDGTRVWQMQTMREMRSPSSGGVKGATTTVVWIKRDDDPGEVLFYGTQEGYVVRWRQRAGTLDFDEDLCVQLTKPGEITGLAFDPLSNRLAICNRNGVVQVHSVDGSMNLRELSTLEIDKSYPRAITFGGITGNERDILVFDLRAGKIYVLRRGEVAATWKVGAFIGDACVDAGRSSICLGDPLYGATVHRIEEGGLRKVNSFPIPAVKTARIRQVAFANQCREVVSGSDHGVIYVFDRKEGHKIDELRVDPSEWVQTVAATEYNGAPAILGAKSSCDDGATSDIFVWKKGDGGRGVAAVPFDLITVVHVFTVLAALAFIYQTIVAGRII